MNLKKAICVMVFGKPLYLLPYESLILGVLLPLNGCQRGYSFGELVKNLMVEVFIYSSFRQLSMKV